MYRFPMGINSFHLPPFCGRFFKYFLVGFSSGTSRIAGFGEGTPQQDLPKGQNRRYADFGTVVESCSDSSRSAPAVKLRISPSAAYNDRKGILPKNVDNFFEKMGVKKRLAMQTAQKNIYLTYEKST